jgi:hypothetical protein
VAAEGLPPKPTQIDCSLAGPVKVGTTFTCAPRLNQTVETQVVIVIEPDGSYLAVGPRLDDETRSVPPLIRGRHREERQHGGDLPGQPEDLSTADQR